MIREFCKENNYEVFENYSGATFLGEIVTTLAIVVEPDRNIFDALAQLTSYLETKPEVKEIDDSGLNELEGTNIDDTDVDSADSYKIYFPFIKDDHPPEP